MLFRAGAPRWLVVSYSPDGKRRWIHRSSPGGVDDLTIAPGGTLFAAGGGADAGEAFGLLRAYSTAGVLRYGRRLRSTRSGLATTLLYVRLDPSGDVVCAGDTNESASFGSYLSDYLVARYDSRGTCQFSDTWAGDSGLEDWVYGLECAADGSIYVCGESNSGNGYSRLVVVPYNASGARGEPMIDQAPPYDEDSCASALSPLGPVVVGSRTIDLDGRIHALVAQFPLLPPAEP